jgi:hypothetical protein
MKRSYLKNVVLAVTCVAAVSMFVLVGSNVLDVGAGAQKVDHMKAWKVYTAKCLNCHDSVADPEKPGRTRDDWRLVVTIMHGYGIGLSDAEADLVTNLLYDLRRGIEREPG